MMAYTKNQQRKEEGKGLRGEIYQIKFIHFRFERWHFVRFRKARRSISCMLSALIMEHQ